MSGKTKVTKKTKRKSTMILYQIPQTRPAHLSPQGKMKKQQSLSSYLQMQVVW